MRSTVRCLKVLDLLAETPYELSLKEIAGRLGIVKGSAHRMVNTLCEADLLAQDPKTKLYRLSPKSFWVGTAYLRHSPIHRAASPLMNEMTRRVRGMAHLAIGYENTLLYLHTISPPDFLYLFAETGERRPLHCTALGKALLARRPESEIDRLYSTGCPRFTPNTITTAAEMKKEARRIRKQGYAVDNEEMVAGVRCVAAPIFGTDGSAVAALSISAPASLLTRAWVSDYAAVVGEAALRASVQLGFRPHTSNIPAIGLRALSEDARE